MIRVLHFAHILNRHDIIDTVLSRLDRNRFEVSALVSMPPRRRFDHAPEEAYPMKVLGFPFTLRSLPRMVRALTGEIRAYRPHVLQAHHYLENLAAAIAVRICRVPSYIVGRHYSDHIYFLTRGLKRWAFLRGEALSNRTADFVAVPSAAVARLLTEHQGVPGSKVAVIPFGLDFRLYASSGLAASAALRTTVGAEGTFLVVACGRLNREKGFEHLLRALAELPDLGDLQTVFVGGGPEEANLRALAHRLGVGERVRFLGLRVDALDWLAAADLVAIPSICESFCQVLVEALAYARPVIMTPVGAAPEVIGRNERGLLVPPGDHRALAAAIREVWTDRESARVRGERGRLYVETHLQADQTARGYEDLYARAVVSPRR